VPTSRFATGSVATLLLLGGCTVGPNFEHPSSWWSLSSWFKQEPAAAPPAPSVPVVEPFDPHWWTVFKDPQLTSLEDKLAAANLDVREADIRLAEARAQLGVTAADGLPQISGNLAYTRGQESRQGIFALSPARPGQSTGALYRPYNLFQAGFDASWEVDLWGRVRREVESSGAQVQASEEAERDTLVTAGAELARDYVTLRGTQLKLQITRENLDVSNQNLKLTQERAAGGVTTDLDVAQAAAQVESTAAVIPGLEQQEAQLINAISFLLGQQPRSLEVELAAPRPVPPVPPTVPVGLPSELARRRPDVREAEAQLHAATANVGVAVADFYPSFTISLNPSFQGLQVHDLWNTGAGTYTFGPNITLPIFEGGRLTRSLELRGAQQQEAAVTYQYTVLRALHDVDDALTAYDKQQRQRLHLEQAVVQNRRALDLARQRYEQGVSDFLQVLIVQRDLLAAELALADSTTTVSTNLVQLYKALGGGWEADLPEKNGAAL
jgi:NodT family efflux transporter outer membrane factor (OMF) lipoprotein